MTSPFSTFLWCFWISLSDSNGFHFWLKWFWPLTNWPSLWRSRSPYASSLVSQAQYSLISVYSGLASADPNLTPIDHWGVLTRRPLSTPPLVHIQYIRWLRHCQSKMLRKLKVEDFPDFKDFLEYDLQICLPGLLWWHCPHSACLQTWKPCK